MKILVVLVACLATAVSACNNGEFQRHSDCAKFRRCDHGVLKDFDCPGGLHWNVAATTCDWPSSAGCTPGGSDPSPTDSCSLNPCVNGVCYVASDFPFYSCQCSTGYSGTNCDQAIATYDWCASNPCERGECSSGQNSFTCTCPQGYSGDRCQYYVGIDRCNPNPCQNNGYCTQAATSSGFQCTCSSQYTGDRCETYTQTGGEVLCASGLPGTQCLNGGACVWYNKFSCSCRTGFTGSRCEYAMTPVTTTTPAPAPTTACSNNPCLNNGICTASGNTFNCECPANYIGSTCQVYNFCWNEPCVKGNCYNLDNDFYCLCPPSYSGKRCDESINPCASNPCSVGGECVVSGSSYECRCKPNYTGSKCEIFNNPCDSSPCGAGGFCTSTDANFFCSCRAGYSGYRCENRDFCLNQDCSQNGQCVTQSTGYECNCNAGYTGENCEFRDFCASNPCINGTCYNEVDNYRCVCPDGYYGNPCKECSQFWQCPLNRMPYVVPNVTDDTKYIICNNGTMSSYDCSANLKFDPLMLQCI